MCDAINFAKLIRGCKSYSRCCYFDRKISPVRGIFNWFDDNNYELTLSNDKCLKMSENNYRENILPTLLTLSFLCISNHRVRSFILDFSYLLRNYNFSRYKISEFLNFRIVHLHDELPTKSTWCIGKLQGVLVWK